MGTKRGHLTVVEAPAASAESTESTEPEQQEQPAAPTIDLRLVLVFLVDGQPVVNLPFDLSVPPVPADAPAGTIPQAVMALDGRVLLKLLEPKLGPTQASAPRLWVPGAPESAPARLKD